MWEEEEVKLKHEYIWWCSVYEWAHTTNMVELRKPVVCEGQNGDSLYKDTYPRGKFAKFQYLL